MIGFGLVAIPTIYEGIFFRKVFYFLMKKEPKLMKKYNPQNDNYFTFLFAHISLARLLFHLTFSKTKYKLIKNYKIISGITLAIKLFGGYLFIFG